LFTPPSQNLQTSRTSNVAGQLVDSRPIGDLSQLAKQRLVLLLLAHRVEVLVVENVVLAAFAEIALQLSDLEAKNLQKWMKLKWLN